MSANSQKRTRFRSNGSGAGVALSSLILIIIQSCKTPSQPSEAALLGGQCRAKFVTHRGLDAEGTEGLQARACRSHRV